MTTDWRILEKKDYFMSGYNQTWQNERCVELELGFRWLDLNKGEKIMEVGAVMSYYAEGGYYELSHELGIAQKDLNKLQNKLFGIECNFEELNGIDFKKGCYVGQENTARIKLKNKLSKRLLPVKLIEGELYADDLIYSGEFEIGKVLINGKYPFALIKFLDDHFIGKIEFKSKNTKLKIKIPSWVKI